MKGSAALPTASFRLSSVEHNLFNIRAKTIRVPLGFGWVANVLLQNKVGMKSHSWKQMVSTAILKYCIRGLLGRHQRQALFLLFDVLAQSCAEVVNINTVDSLERDVHRVLSQLERDFPVSLHVSVFHLLHHLPFYIGQYGPAYSFWMYPFERFNSWIIRRVHNRRYPELTVVETYRLYEWAHSLQISGDLPDNALLHLNDTEQVDSTAVQVSTELSSDQFLHLQHHYQETVPLYKNLCSRYETARKRAQVRHELRKFPSMSCWTPTTGPHLTLEETKMQNISGDVVRLGRYTYRDPHGRAVTLTSKDADTKSSTSSYVFVHQPDDSNMFGQIEFLFMHTFCGNSTMFAFVRWF